MTSKPIQQPDEEVNRMVCFCYTVRLTALQTAIRNGSDTLEKLKIETNASCGCGGCEWDVLSVLEEELKKK